MTNDDTIRLRAMEIVFEMSNSSEKIHEMLVEKGMLYWDWVRHI